jgi:CBS domain-containing protein
MHPTDTPAIETRSTVSARPTGVSRLADLFQWINSVIPEAQEVVTVAPSTTAGEAVALLEQHRFSQVPVVRGGEVLGSFPYRSFARGAVELQQGHGALGELPAEEFMEALDIAYATEELASIFDALDRDDAVLVGAPNDLQAVVTPMDALRYLYRLTEPYVQLGEIERSFPSAAMGLIRDVSTAEAGQRYFRAPGRREWGSALYHVVTASVLAEA